MHTYLEDNNCPYNVMPAGFFLMYCSMQPITSRIKCTTKNFSMASHICLVHMVTPNNRIVAVTCTTMNVGLQWAKLSQF